ncbi:MAG: protein translocase subunit SecD [Candidatus Auribacter fodinae]|jgi:SecD/SecF fusion protein|uniref:Multifunctional fusion protein n=1 Tax=Candidatus Auribacter fodinae TaxID=2093366 RepID=A0A3A4R391_9BACT|nr:MAG: protein translocase subunit SecD [Candidatus Auribacter fodinae]
MNRNLLLRSALILAVVAIAAYFSFPPFDTAARKGKINLGLDLKGGVHLVWQINKEKLNEMGMGADLREDSIHRAVEVIRNRIDALGVKEPSIFIQGTDRIVVELPGIDNPGEAIKTIGDVAFLEFRLVDDDPQKITEAQNGRLPLGWELKYQIIPTERGDKEKIPMLVQARPVLTGDMLETAYPTSGSGFGMPEVGIEFTREGAKRFGTVTRENINKRLAILLDDVIVSAPVIRTEIPNGRAVIQGQFTSQEVQRLSRQLSGGALPVPLSLIDNRSISPTLGSDSVRQGVSAAMYGFILVVLFMAVYYFISGFIADLALCINIIMITGVLGALGFTLTLPGIAGIVLTIGMAVDANVLIFERIREERLSGKSVHESIAAGFKRAFMTIFDANITTLITAAFLFQFGTGPVKGFAVTLTIGILASMFTALFVSRVIYDILITKFDFKNLKMMRFVGDTKFDFIGKRTVAIIGSAVIIVVGMGYFMYRGDANFGIDFTGGTLVQIRGSQNIPLDEVRNKLRDIGQEKAVIQYFGNDEKDVLIKTSADAAENIFSTLKTSFTSYDLTRVRTEFVGPAIGAELRQQALLAIVFALMGILVYISWRFEFRFALGAIVALIHDVLITLGIFSMSGREISLPTIAALLTIVGYSLNDTIVVFDRIREDMNVYKKSNFHDIINMSINQTLSRTTLTSFTTLIVVIALYFLGGEVINDFAFALLVGIVFGTYSSIFIASPVLLLMEKIKKN